jgi:HEAT repeats
MKRTRQKLTVKGLAACGVLLFVCACHDLGPVFEGKTLDFWLRQYRSTAANPDKVVQNEQAVRAVRSIGTNAVPALLKMVRAKGSKYGLSDLNIKGVDGFYILGAAASNAVPELVEIFEENKYPTSRASAAHALEGIGSGAFAFMALAKIPASCDRVIPIATQALNDTNFLVDYEAMNVLGNCGTSAKEAVPALVEMLTNADIKLRRSASVTLGKIHSLPDITIPALIGCLSDPAAYVRGEAAWDLGNFGTLAKKAIPALLQLKNDKDSRVRGAAEGALRKINLEKN